MKLKNVKTIRGSGFKHLDGSLVTVVDEGDDGYVSVIPYGEKSVPIKIDSRCVQEVNIQRVVSYEFHLVKYEGDLGNEDNLKILQQHRYYIDDALRDVDLDVIVDFLDNNLKPILRME